MKLRASWPAYVVAAGMAFGLLAAARVGTMIPATPAVTILLVAIWQAMAAAIAAAVILAGTGLERALRRPLTIEQTAAPRAIVGLLAASTLIAGAVIASYVVTTWLVALELIAVVVAVAMLRGGRRPWRAAPAALALVTVIVLVNGARELDHVGVTWNRSHTTANRHYDQNSDCNGTNWDGELSMANLADHYQVVASPTGNVGRMVTPAAPATGHGVLTVHVLGGHADIGWLSCLMPLHKSASFDTRVLYTATVSQPGARCTANGQLDLHVEITIDGFAACRDLREHLAAELQRQLDRHAQTLAGESS